MPDIYDICFIIRGRSYLPGYVRHYYKTMLAREMKEWGL